jgi:hypothetical protein
MRKKIIIILGIMLLSIMMFGCSKSDDLKLPKNLELKEEYKSKVSAEFTETLNKIVTKYVEIYNQKEQLQITDLNPLLELDLTPDNVKLNDTERLLLGKSVKIQTHLVSECDKPTAENKIKLKVDTQILLDCYK